MYSFMNIHGSDPSSCLVCNFSGNQLHRGRLGHCMYVAASASIEKWRDHTCRELLLALESLEYLPCLFAACNPNVPYLFWCQDGCHYNPAVGHNLQGFALLSEPRKLGQQKCPQIETLFTDTLLCHTAQGARCTHP